MRKGRIVCIEYKLGNSMVGDGRWNRFISIADAIGADEFRCERGSGYGFEQFECSRIRCV